ncbi:uncharacterized protein [Onthophagus taurus]|uniref:uncharacterized protein n=1 Tax=Onthophagus taurus TaxID=166361 RepID=UPI000C205BB5|nr:uncharacterized protein LOC111428244 [Onthophagus taurus]
MMLRYVLLATIVIVVVHGQNESAEHEISSGETMAPSPEPGPIESCDQDMIGFELITGYVFSAPPNAMSTFNTVMLTDCLEMCAGNDSCQAVNFETGLCILFNTNAEVLPGALTESELPVFTIYAQKSCLGVKPCEKSWCIDRVQNHRLVGYTQSYHTVNNRQECFELCLGETDFTCRSANYNNVTGNCELSNMDRMTVAGSTSFQGAKGYDYMENNCIDEPTKLCEFKKLEGRIIKTVDSLYEDVPSIDECRDLCLNALYRCHSYDYGDAGEMICRLSHHSRATLSDIHEPYIGVPEGATYELSSCYNVSIDCRSGDMVAKIQTSKLFDGKIYAKGSPKSCVRDIKNSLEFELEMAYDDVECNVRKNGLGRYVNDVVIQHHDKIVTSSDLGLAVTCQYDLTNKSVTNEVDLGVHGDIQPELTEEVTVDSPNVAMKITDRSGGDVMPTAEVGDPLALRFEIMDKNSPYEIFVRELVAMDGVDSSEIVLIDQDGCPTDHFIMGPIYKSADTGKILLSHFDAFKFPSSEVVQFRALVTPCMPSCEPVQCNQEGTTGELRSVISYGKRRRRRSANPQDNYLLVEQIRITDKFGFHSQNKSTSVANEAVYLPNSDGGFCINVAGLVVAGTIFLASQLAIIAAWTFIWQRRRIDGKLNDSMSVSVSLPSVLTASRSDSLSKLYDTGYARRF